MHAGILAVLVVLGGCVETDSVMCGDITCPADSHCGPANECVPASCGLSIASRSR